MAGLGGLNGDGGYGAYGGAGGAGDKGGRGKGLSVETRDFVTESQANFSAKPVPRMEQQKIQNVQRPNIPFQATTTYNSDFGPKVFELPQPLVQPERMAFPEDRDFGTTYGSSYVPRTVARCPVGALPKIPNPVEEEVKHI
eukprot:GHVO01003866.1.p1 GENE.GHVO01003866.1~~GHVO01003866.1.p1  ORF type:complete len:141 (-),score=17.94 GHVO01003866.1:13-435(-)